MPPTINTNTKNDNPVIIAHEVIIEGTPPRPGTIRSLENPGVPQDPRIRQREIYEIQTREIHEVDSQKLKELAACLNKETHSIHQKAIRENVDMGTQMIFAKLDQARRETDPGFKKLEVQEALYYLRILNDLRSNPYFGGEEKENLDQLNQAYLDQVRTMNLGDPRLLHLFFLNPNSRTKVPFEAPFEINELLKRDLSADLVFSEIAKDFPGPKQKRTY